ERLEAYYAKSGSAVKQVPWTLMENNYVVSNVYKLLKAYKPKAAMPVLYRIATGKAYQGNTLSLNDKNIPVMIPQGRAANAAAVDDAKKQVKTTYYSSTRTQFIELFVEATGQNLEDYKLSRAKNFGDYWAVPTAEDEDKAVEKIKAWWAEHGKEF